MFRYLVLDFQALISGHLIEGLLEFSADFLVLVFPVLQFISHVIQLLLHLGGLALRMSRLDLCHLILVKGFKVYEFISMRPLACMECLHYIIAENPTYEIGIGIRMYLLKMHGMIWQISAENVLSYIHSIMSMGLARMM